VYTPSFLIYPKKKYLYTLKTKLFIALCVLALHSCESPSRPSKFIEATDSGVTFTNTVTNSIQLNILNYLYFYNGAGSAIADFNNDGLQDLYFTANQGADHLYINKGNFQFENSTSISNIDNANGWTSGVTTVDINNDGWMDIYISKVSGHLDLEGSNLLYVNQGVDDSGIPRFKEEAAAYGLNLSALSTQASFFDYDLDGDLDVYILNHSLHPNSNYGKGALRKKIDSVRGDKLLENKNGIYTDVTKDTGIYQSSIGYGLGISTGDVNNDGYPDIYLGNDFFENDYLYINQKNGTFIEVNATASILGHSSHFSMGNGMSDINNDGNLDILSLDMLPEDIETLKSSGTEYNYPIFQNQLRNGYEPQFMQNTLHLNLGNEKFSETAFLSGISATEWSWSPIIADFDNDGYKDIYITNGIQGATNDMDFVNFISNESIQKRLGKGMKSEELAFINELPEKKTINYFYKNKGNASFEDVSDIWSSRTPSFSNGASYADLDNDGDLDIIVNNVNAPAFILKNTTDHSNNTSNYLQISFKGSAQNTFGIGTKIQLYTKTEKQFLENYPTQGFLSSVPPIAHIGLGTYLSIDSLKVIWSDGKYQTLKNIEANQHITLDYSEAQGDYYQQEAHTSPNYLKSRKSLIPFTHQDGTSIEFNRDPLIPYATTNLGASIITGHINKDPYEDIITLGAKGQASSIWLQNEEGAFIPQELPDAKITAINEDTHALIFDADGDQTNDVLIVSGGNEFKNGAPLTPRLYINKKDALIRDSLQFKDIFINASTVTAVDIDNDQDLDICITSNVTPHQFGKTPQQYIFQNNGTGDFKDITVTYAPHFQYIGSVYDIIWKDLNSNGYLDAIVVGHWMPISIFLNDGKTLQLQNTSGLENTHGWWNTVDVGDFDNDGDQDIVAGNWGLNTRLQPSLDEPITLYRNDFDNNKQIDPIVTYYHQGKETTIATKDELVKQIPLINKKFLSYNAFAKAEIRELFGKKKLQEAEKKKAYQLASVYYENIGNASFKSHPLPFLAQSSSVHDMAVDDFNEDGYPDLLLVGNTYEISTQLGRLDASHGVFLQNDKKGGFRVLGNQEWDINGASRSIEQIKIKDSTFYIVGRNNDTPLFLKKENE